MHLGCCWLHGWPGVLAGRPVEEGAGGPRKGLLRVVLQQAQAARLLPLPGEAQPALHTPSLAALLTLAQVVILTAGGPEDPGTLTSVI